MKFITLYLLPVIYGFFSLTGYPSPSRESNATTSSAVELIDLQNITFASGLRDWKNRAIDNLVMDMYYPTNATSHKKYPLLLFCHAGGFTGGNRFNVSAICDRFADEGFISVGFEYRVGYKKGNPRNCEADTATLDNAIYRAMQDANACLRFLVAHADEYNIDTSKIFVGGSSAGATLALNSSYINDSIAQIILKKSYTLLGGLQTSGNTLTNTYSIKGLVNMWGALLADDKIINTSYKAYPTIIFKGEEDGGLPDSMGHFDNCPTYPVLFAGIAIYNRLRLLNVPAVFHYLPMGNHSAYDDQFCVKNAGCFLRSVLNGTAYSGYYTGYDVSCP